MATTVCCCYHNEFRCRRSIIEVVKPVTLPFLPHLQFSAPAQTPKRIVSPTSIHPGRHIQPLGKYCSITKSLRASSLYKIPAIPRNTAIGTHPPSCYPACHHPKGVGMARSKTSTGLNSPGQSQKFTKHIVWC